MTVPMKSDAGARDGGVAGAGDLMRFAEPVKETASAIADFAAEHWQGLTVGGIVVSAGAAFVASRPGLAVVGKVLRAGQSLVGTADHAVPFGGELTADVAKRLRQTKHWIFDLDRTLIDHDGSLAALQKTMSDQLVHHSGLSREFIDKALADTTKRLDSPFFYNRLDQIRPLQEKFPGVDLNEHFAEVARTSKSAYYDALTASPEVREMLDQIRKIDGHVHVFSGSSTARALEKLRGSGLLDEVENIYASGVNAFEDTAGSGLLTKAAAGRNVFTLSQDAKTSGSGYDVIFKHLQDRPRNMAMTGDHPFEDVFNSRKRGMLAIKANWYRNVPPKNENILPDLEIDTPSRLTRVLQSISLKSAS